MSAIIRFLHINWVVFTLIAGLAWILGLRIYYWLKPSLPVLVRLVLHRWWARRKLASCGDKWPILESAGAAPQGWSGWPDGARFALVLTHDVEAQRGVDGVKQLAEVEMALGFRSSFNFVPEGPYRVTVELRQWLVERGFEVGVHDHRHDGKLYNSRSRFLAGAARINHFLREWNAVGFRSGFMFHNLEWIKDLNVAYDSSTFDTDPFEPQPDGVKTIFPFWVAGRDGRGYVELPYTLVQDSTLFVMLQEKSNKIWKRKLAWITTRGGMALLNVHPDYIAFGDQRPEWDKYSVTHYAEFLGWVKETYGGQYWHVLPKSVAEFSRKLTPKLLPLAVLMHERSESLLRVV